MTPRNGSTGRATTWDWRSWRLLLASPAFRIAAVAFVVYQLNLRSVSSADTFPMRYAPISILTEGDLDFDEFGFLRAEPEKTPGFEPGMPYYLQYRRGHYMSTPPLMVGVLATPVYVIPVWLGLTGDPSEPRPADGGITRTEVVGTLLAKLAASLMVALSISLVYLGLNRLQGPSAARWITLAYAFATSSWSVSSQGLWQTTGSQLLLAGAFLAMLRAEGARARPMIVLAGALVALAVMSRPTTIIFALLLTLFVAHAQREHLWAYLPIPAVLGGLLLGYNTYYFGALAGGYEGVNVEQVLTGSQLSLGLRGLLVSPNRGLLVFSPVVLPGVVGAILAFRRGAPLLLRYLAIGVASTVAFYATMPQWHGQFSFSYRYLVDLLPALALLAAPTWAWITGRAHRRAILAALAIYSVAIQVVGAFYYPCDWYRSTRNNPAAMARFFDWTDLEVVQCLQAGPVEPDGVRLLRGLVRGRASD